MLIIFYQPELKKKLAKGIIHKIVNDVLSGENKKKSIVDLLKGLSKKSRTW